MPESIAAAIAAMSDIGRLEVAEEFVGKLFNTCGSFTDMLSKLQVEMVSLRQKLTESLERNEHLKAMLHHQEKATYNAQERPGDIKLNLKWRSSTTTLEMYGVLKFLHGNQIWR